MKHLGRTIAFVLAVALLAGIAVGCGPKFDAAGYVKSMLDSAYLNQHDDVEKFTESSKEDSVKTYEENMADEGKELAESIASQFGMDPTDEQIALVTDFVKLSYSKVHYTVGKATADGKNFVVPVTYETLKLYSDANVNAVTEAQNKWLEEKADEIDAAETEEDQAALVNEYFKMYIGAWTDCLNAPEYEDSETVEMHVELGSDNIYDIPDADYEELFTNLIQ